GVTAKKCPVLFEFSARYDASPSPGDTAPLSITLPDGRTIQAHDPDASTLLSAALGRTVRLEHQRPLWWRGRGYALAVRKLCTRLGRPRAFAGPQIDLRGR